MHSTLIKEVIWYPHFIFSEIIVQKNINLHDHFSFKVLSPFFNTYKQRQLVNTASVLSSVQGRMSEKDSHLGKCPTHENTLITSKTFSRRTFLEPNTSNHNDSLIDHFQMIIYLDARKMIVIIRSEKYLSGTTPPLSHVQTKRQSI